MELVGWLENAEREITQGEFESAINSFEEAEYLVKEFATLNSKESEAYGLFTDATFAVKTEQYDTALVFTEMAIDVLTLPEVEGYEFNQVGADTAEAEIDALMNKEIDADDEMETVQWHIDMRRAEQKLVRILVEDHARRFSKN